MNTPTGNAIKKKGNTTDIITDVHALLASCDIKRALIKEAIIAINSRKKLAWKPP
jgi:hypothetical protein